MVHINTRNALMGTAILLLFLVRGFVNETINGILIGMLSLYLGMQIKEYGIGNVFLSDPRKVNTLFRAIKEGNLEELKKL